jgi:hypothetical protein
VVDGTEAALPYRKGSLEVQDLDNVALDLCSFESLLDRYHTFLLECGHIQGHEHLFSMAEHRTYQPWNALRGFNHNLLRHWSHMLFAPTCSWTARLFVWRSGDCPAMPMGLHVGHLKYNHRMLDIEARSLLHATKVLWRDAWP